MDERKIYEYLIDELKSIIPNNSELIDKLSDILFIGKEGIYRRMRGEVPFTLEEASIICHNMGISLDSFIGVSAVKRPFVFKIANFANPQNTDYKLINEFVDFLEPIKDDPDTEMGIATKIIPDTLHLNYPYITSFYLFKWMYQYDNKAIKKFGEIKGTDKLLGILNDMANLLQHIKNTYYIFDQRIFENFVEDIKYFNQIRLISNDDMKLLKKDLYTCLNDIELLAIKGVNHMGNKTQIYLSNINFETDFSYVKSHKHKLSKIRVFTIYDISSNDATTYENLLRWMSSLKKTSSLISESGEIERTAFFKKQYDIINTL